MTLALVMAGRRPSPQSYRADKAVHYCLQARVRVGTFVRRRSSHDRLGNTGGEEELCCVVVRYSAVTRIFSHSKVCVIRTSGIWTAENARNRYESVRDTRLPTAHTVSVRGVLCRFTGVKSLAFATQ